MREELEQLPSLANEKSDENKKFFKKLRKKPPKNLDYVMQELHDIQFSKTDCLQCANCCKTTGPLFTSADIERIAKHLRLKPSAFIDAYLRVDEEGELIIKIARYKLLGDQLIRLLLHKS